MKKLIILMIFMLVGCNGNPVTTQEQALHELPRELASIIENSESLLFEIEDAGNNSWQILQEKAAILHHDWNSLEPVLAREGAARTDLQIFNSHLNGLSMSLRAMDRMNSLIALNSGYEQLSAFIGLFEDAPRPDFYKTLMNARLVSYAARQTNWDKASSALENVRSYWKVLKQGGGEWETRMETALNNLEQVVKDKNVYLVNIKCAILVDTLLEKIPG